MKIGVIALAVATLLAGAQARADGCGQTLRLGVEPKEKMAEVAATLKRRLEAAGAPPAVEVDADGLSVTLPKGGSETLLTRPARVEFRLVASADDAPGAVSLPRLAGGRESVAPEIILDETHLREFQTREAGDHAAFAFHFDPHAMKNLMAATAEGLGRKLAIVVDDVVVADPVIRAPVASAVGEIDAGLSPASTQELVGLLPEGRLTAKVSVLARAPCNTP